MAKILITGSTGFIGLHLAAALARPEHEITCLVRKTSHLDGLRSLGLRLCVGDLTVRDSLLKAVRGQETVFQLAGCVRASRAAEFYQVNEEGVRNLAEACARQAEPPVLVTVSSLAAAGPSPPGHLRTEAEPLAPVSHYGRSKLAGEKAVRGVAHCVPATIVRPAIVFGEGDPATYNIFWPVARLGLHLTPTWRDCQYSLIHVQDLVRLLILAARQGRRLLPEGDDHPAAAARGCYFAACEQAPTYAELGRMIGAAVGRRRVRVIRSGPALVWAAAFFHTAWGRLRRRPCYFGLDKAREARAGSWVCSDEAARRELGFQVGAPWISGCGRPLCGIASKVGCNGVCSILDRAMRKRHNE